MTKAPVYDSNSISRTVVALAVRIYTTSSCRPAYIADWDYLELPACETDADYCGGLVSCAEVQAVFQEQ